MNAAENINTRKEQAENTKQKLLDSARLLFAENGYKGTSIRSINRRIGVADGLLYHYFPGGKKEIFHTIVTQNFEKVKEEILEKRNDYSKNTDLEKILISTYENFTKIIDENIDIIRIIIKENEVAQFIPKESISEIMQCMREHFAKFLCEREKIGEIKKFDFESAADTVLAVLINYLLITAMNLHPDGKPNKEKAVNIIKYNLDLWKNN